MSDEAKQFIDSPALLEEAIDWIADAFCAKRSYIATFSAAKVYGMIDRQYEGGVDAFVKASAPLA